MKQIWTFAWRAPCVTVRAATITQINAPIALNSGNFAGRSQASPIQQLKHYAFSTEPYRQHTISSGDRKLPWTNRWSICNATQCWFRARHKSSSATSSKRRPHGRLSPTRLPPAKLAQNQSSQSELPHVGLPDNYDPEEGVRFRPEDLSGQEITSIFGPDLAKDEGNRLLRVLHGQRVFGTLDQGITIPHANLYVDRLVATGLIWLRANYPMDEDAAIMARIEKEQREEEEEILSDAQKMGLLPQQGADKRSVYGVSGLDAIRQHYESLPVNEYKPKVDIDQPRIGKLQPVHQKGELTARTKWLKYWSDRALIYPGDEAPKMSIWQRLWPSALVTIIVVGFSVFFAQNYVPPPRAARLWPDMPPAAATLIGVIIANSIILVLWRFPPAWRMLNQYFMSTPGYPSALSVVGNIFSHQQVTHFFPNMLVLWFIGTRLHDDIGRGNFLAIYLASGVLGSFLSLSVCVFTSAFHVSSLGASGALAGVVGAWCMTNSDKRFSLIFLPPDLLPSLSWSIVLSFLIIVEVLGASRGWRRLDHWAHLGGYATGIAGALMLRVKQRNQKLLEVERRKKLGFIDRIREGPL